MGEPIFEHLRDEASRAWHGVTGHLHRRGYHESGPDRSEGDEMSLESAVSTIEHDAREGLQNVISWATQVIDTHLPSAVADIRAVAGSTIFKAVEAAVLTPAEEAVVTRLIGDIVSLRARPQPDADEATPAEAAQDPAAA